MERGVDIKRPGLECEVHRCGCWWHLNGDEKQVGTAHGWREGKYWEGPSSLCALLSYLWLWLPSSSGFKYYLYIVPSIFAYNLLIRKMGFGVLHSMSEFLL